ncbi:tRNA epoxyqueuosine(34) reductase QueG [Rhodovibrionaceae bacterium A322]
MLAIKETIRQQALELGFQSVGFAPPDLSLQDRANLQSYVDQGFHGSMAWMPDTLERRWSPRALWPETGSVIVLATTYGPAVDPLKLLEMPERGNISVYARNRDYHDTVKKRLKALARWLHQEMDCGVKVFVDTAPVMEKPLAMAGGLGWQGKHSNLLSRDLGNWFFLGEVFTTLPLPPDEAEVSHCGSCRACLDICPTQAFPAPYQVDARRCISYLTIEHKGHIEPEFRRPMGNRIYGCDDCLAVCPWNKFATPTDEAAFLPRIELTAPKLADLVGLDDQGFRQVFTASPIKRIGRNRFVRNVLIAIGNSGEPSLVPRVVPLLEDESNLVRAMAVWALAQLIDDGKFETLREAHLPGEEDDQVRQEWQNGRAS